MWNLTAEWEIKDEAAPILEEITVLLMGLAPPPSSLFLFIVLTCVTIYFYTLPLLVIFVSWPFPVVLVIFLSEHLCSVPLPFGLP